MLVQVKKNPTVVSLTCLSWLQIMCLNRELFEKHDSKCVQSCLDVEKHMVYFMHAKKLPYYFLSPLYFSNAVFSMNGTHVLIVKVAFFQYSLKLITLVAVGLCSSFVNSYLCYYTSTKQCFTLPVYQTITPLCFNPL